MRPSSWYMHHVSIVLVQDLNSCPPFAIIYARFLEAKNFLRSWTRLGDSKTCPFNPSVPGVGLPLLRCLPVLLCSCRVNSLTCSTMRVEEGSFSQRIASFLSHHLMTRHAFQPALHSTLICKVNTRCQSTICPATLPTSLHA